MAKGKRITDGKTLVVYSTKVTLETRALLDALAKANGPDFGQRELLEEMVGLYQTHRPEAARKAQAILELLGGPSEGSAAAAPIDFAAAPVDFAAKEQEVAEQMGATLPKTVKTVRYQGRPQVHLYDPDRPHKSACNLEGNIDPDSIEDGSPDAVDCKKCRYCRKAVFA